MTDKDLKKLTRKELLELLIEQGKENERLQASLEESRKRFKEMNEKLKTRDLKIENTGSLAEAALQLSGIFEAADDAVKTYVENVEKNYLKQQEEYDRIINDAKAKAAAIITDAEKEKESLIDQANTYWQDFAFKVESFVNSRNELKDLLNKHSDMMK